MLYKINIIIAILLCVFPGESNAQSQQVSPDDSYNLVPAIEKMKGKMKEGKNFIAKAGTVSAYAIVKNKAIVTYEVYDSTGAKLDYKYEVKACRVCCYHRQWCRPGCFQVPCYRIAN